MNIISTIIPIFSTILLGWTAYRRGFMPQTFIAPANRLVYYLAIPAMIFRAIAKNRLNHDFHPDIILIALLSMLLIFGAAWAIGKLLRLRQGRLATYIQSSYHCNIGYLALAVAYYYLGESGFARASILAGFVMILQNFLSVLILTIYSSQPLPGRQILPILSKTFGNPVILSAAAGICFSLTGLRLPLVVTRTLDIVSGLALPTALLIIGATLSFRLIRHNAYLVAGTALTKLILMPGAALLLFQLHEIPRADFLPALILLASPTATLTYIMAEEMRGDTDFAVAAISLTTLLSAFSFTIWLSLPV